MSFTKNGLTPVNPQKIDLNTPQVIEQNVTSGEITETTSLIKQQLTPTFSMDQLKSKPIMEQIQSLEDQLKPKPSETPSNDNVNANVVDVNKTKKVNSWASNYLQSIGHNNPIKANLPSCRNKLQRVETISATSKPNKIVVQPTLLKCRTCPFKVSNTTDNPLEFSQPKEKIFGEHIDIDKNGIAKTMHPTNVNVCRSYTNEKVDVHVKTAPVHPRSQNITSIPVKSNMLDTIYSNVNHSRATLLTKGIAKAKYCNNEAKCEIDVLDFIKSNIKREFTIEQKTRTMNLLPTHKDMCEDFTKEISINKASTSEEMKGDHPKLSPANNEELIHYTKEYTSEKKLVKNEKNELKKEERKESSKAFQKQDRVEKSKSSLKIDQSVKKENYLDKEYKKQQNKNPINKLNDYDGPYEHINKKTQSYSPERQKLKRVRTNSEGNSEVRTHFSTKNVVHVAENCVTNPPKRQCLVNESFDLRSKLSRANPIVYKKTLMQNDTQSVNKKQKKRENLKITVETQSNNKQKSPKKSGVVKKKEKKKCQQLKLIINVVTRGSDGETSSSDSSYSETENNPTHNMDLSFLDDFNVDEIVDSLDKTEEYTKRPSEPELKQYTVNMLNAKSNKFRNPAGTDCKIEKTMKINGLARSNTLNNSPPPVPSRTLSSVPQFKKSRLKNEEQVANTEDKSNKSTTMSQKMDVEEVTAILDKNENIILDLTKDIEDGEIKSTQDFEEITAILDKDKEIILDLNNEFEGNGIKSNLDVEKVIFVLDKNEEITVVDLTNDIGFAEIKSNLCTNKAVDSVGSVGKKHNIAANCAARNPSENYAKTQMEIVSEMFIEQEIHLIPLPNSDIDNISEKNGKAGETGSVNDAKVTQIELIEEKTQPSNGYGHSVTRKEIIYKDNIKKESFETVKVCEVTNIKTKEEKLKKVENIAEANIEQCNTVKKNNAANKTKNISKEVERAPTKKVNKNIVEYVWDAYVWDSKNEPENTITNIIDTKTEPGVESQNNNAAKNVPGNTFKTNKAAKNEPGNTYNTNDYNKNKPGTSKTEIKGMEIMNETNLPGQHKVPTVRLEQKMLACLHKQIKITEHIHQGKYSSIFICKDANDQTYTAKVLRAHHKISILGFQKQQMIKQLQKDIPKDKLNTVYLIDCFYTEKCWFFLTEFYPKNLQQVLNERVEMKPFHINRVQHLARQLISAVMVLRNNEIVHSDIRPSHILLNATQDRLKLCGFDEAYYMKNAKLHSTIGTADYRAPEIILGFSAGYSIDVWSSALVIHEMATSQKLFAGIQNNDILLYEQMVIFGKLPQDMVDASLYKNRHFCTIFQYNRKYAGLVQNLNKTKWLQITLTNAYEKHWTTRNLYEQVSDKFKLTILNNLLERMLLLDPRWRLAVKYVCADPFIYEKFA